MISPSEEEEREPSTVSPARMTPDQLKAKQNKDRKTGIIAIVVIIVLAVGGVFGYAALFGAKQGEKCEETMGCMIHGVCISHRCQKRCDQNKDCDSGYHCGTTDVTVTTRHTFGEDKEESTEKICFKDQAAASAKPAR
jgi:hypothetical protein